MTMIKQDNVFRNGASLIVSFTLVVSVLMVIIAMIKYQQYSLVEAVNELHICEQRGGIECHIERDGFNYNVYSW